VRQSSPGLSIVVRACSAALDDPLPGGAVGHRRCRCARLLAAAASGRASPRPRALSAAVRLPPRRPVRPAAAPPAVPGRSLPGQRSAAAGDADVDATAPGDVLRRGSAEDDGGDRSLRQS